ncbi:amino acid ABC transporter permease [Ruegeria arenilitoris]|jgi:polar amino acid transport system permease protein|uniref:amino acid ABC transporter permease n=1 Tax=Ruegeria arenilitoris TaxID=1173585 RepID=UPI00148181AA|nr:amino acid ABC transporter permease [Ruegeria arenilitoris]
MSSSAENQSVSVYLDPEKLKVIPLRHPGRVIAATLVVIGVLFLVNGAVTNQALQWHIVGKYLFHPLIMKGLWTTIWLTIVVMALATAMGMVAALMMMSTSKLLAIPARVFVWFFRGTPALVQLILWYNLAILVKNIGIGIPGVVMLVSVPTNDVMTPFVAATIALSLHESGYMAEIIRGGLMSVNKGQTEAAACLGMKPSLLTRRIIIPQAMRMIIPPTGNETINLLKTTSLVSIIAVGDLLYSAQAIYARTFETIPLLIVVTFWYLVVVSIMSVGQGYLERYYGKEDHGDAEGFLKSLFKFNRRK